MAFSFVQSLVRHSLRYVGDMLGGGVVPVGSIAAAIFDDWKSAGQARDTASLRAQLERVVQDVHAYRQDIDMLLYSAGLKPGTSARHTLETYLRQVPGRIQCSFRRLDDPTGRTVPPGLPLRRAEDLELLLPERLPRMQTGARPIQGTDLVLQELIGTGGFGEVWKAVHQDRPHAAPVALKFCTNDIAARTLRREVDLLDRLRRHGRHEGLVELHYAHLEADPPCLEYEYVDGGDLAGLVLELQRRGDATPARLTRLFQSLVEAVAVAHRMQPPVVHRDLKPANVLTTRSAGQVLLKVADFGIGALAAHVASHEYAQRTCDTVGFPGRTLSTGSYTPLYASPQQRRGCAPDPRDDVYALGVIWFQMLVGDFSLEAPTGNSWKHALSRRGVSARAIDLLERCLEHDPACRPADARALATEFADRLDAERAQDSPVILQPPPLPPPRCTGRILLTGQWVHGAMPIAISLDGEDLWECRLFDGCDIPFEVTPGDHCLAVRFGNRKKTYRVSLSAPAHYTISLKYSAGFLGLAPEFAEHVHVLREPPSHTQTSRARLLRSSDFRPAPHDAAAVRLVYLPSGWQMRNAPIELYLDQQCVGRGRLRSDSVSHLVVPVGEHSLRLRMALPLVWKEMGTSLVRLPTAECYEVQAHVDAPSARLTHVDVRPVPPA